MWRSWSRLPEKVFCSAASSVSSRVRFGERGTLVWQQGTGLFDESKLILFVQNEQSKSCVLENHLLENRFKNTNSAGLCALELRLHKAWTKQPVLPPLLPYKLHKSREPSSNAWLNNVVAAPDMKVVPWFSCTIYVSSYCALLMAHDIHTALVYLTWNVLAYTDFLLCLGPSSACWLLNKYIFNLLVPFVSNLRN